MSEDIFNGELVHAEADGSIATLVFNRPEKLNALTTTMRGELLAAFDLVENTADIRVVILTGAGRGFCAGGDIDYLAELRANNDRDGFLRILNEGTEVVRRFRVSELPIIAAINGVAVGGGLILALACDLRIAVDSAKLGLPFAKIGMGPDWGGTSMLTHLAGAGIALELLLTARLFSAQEALAAGMVNRVCGDDELKETVSQTAGAVARFERDISGRYKRAVYAAETGDHRLALETERICQLAFFDHPDFADRLARFKK